MNTQTRGDILAERIEAIMAQPNLETERDELRAEVELLKADKARLDWMQDNYTDTVFIGEGEFGEGMLREALDDAMKGDE